MAKTWIVVAHRGGARVFENKGPGKGLDLLREIDHPEGRLKNREIDTDKPGRSYESHGAARHAYDKERESTTHVAEQFAKQISGILDEGRNRQAYGRLVLVADPRFLGNLRSALSRETASLVLATIDKDLGGVDQREMAKHLDGVMVV
ncbi:MAG: host attachment protein [Pseudomonadota bacterium]